MATTRIAVLQSAYIPWRGFFDLLRQVDLFVLYDSVQYTKGGWRNRNRILTPRGPCWLTIPVRVAGRSRQSIKDAEIDSPRWVRHHWATLAMNYARAPRFKEVAPVLAPLYEASRGDVHLTSVNERFLRALAARMGVTTEIVRSEAFGQAGGRIERLVSICRQAGATEYVTGPAARAYLDEGPFLRDGIRVRWFHYRGYQPYPQLHVGSFCDHLSIVDLLMNTGFDDARRFIDRQESPFED